MQTTKPSFLTLFLRSSLANPYGCSFGHEVKELHDFGVPHPHTTMAAALTDAIFIIGAVDINVTVKGVGVTIFCA
jgi:hypothetical protein